MKMMMGKYIIIVIIARKKRVNASVERLNGSKTLSFSS